MDTSFLTTWQTYNHLSLDEALEAISHHPKVLGILVIGSTADTTRFKPYSDYDILVVWEETRPIHVVLTYIDHKLADVVFTDKPTLEKLIQEQAYIHTTEASLCHWLRSGTIRYDRDGFLAPIQAEFQRRDTTLPVSKDYVFGVWFGVHYNFHQNWRMWESGDTLYHQALHFRLLYGLWGVVIAYFIVRELPWSGEKDAIRYWTANDPDYYTLFQKVMNTSDLAEKMPAYQELAERTLQPVGGLYSEQITIIEPVDLTPMSGDFMQSLGTIVQEMLD